MPGVAEALEAGTACGIVCITMDPCGLMICCPGADTICRMLPKLTTQIKQQILEMPSQYPTIARIAFKTHLGIKLQVTTTNYHAAGIKVCMTKQKQ